MKIDWKSWKVGATLGAFAALSFCAIFVFQSQRWDGLSVTAGIVFFSSILLLSVWTTWRTTSWKARGVGGLLFLLWIAGAYLAFLFQPEKETCVCVVAPSKYSVSEMGPLKEKAEKGDTVAMNMLDDMYQQGSGVKQDYVEAYFWGSLAAKLKGWTLEPEKPITAEQKLAVDKRVGRNGSRPTISRCLRVQ